jgi:hypothetical protein
MEAYPRPAPKERTERSTAGRKSSVHSAVLLTKRMTPVAGGAPLIAALRRR